MTSSPSILEEAYEAACSALMAEAEALRVAAERLKDRLPRAVELLLERQGKIVVLGVGKSGHIAQKIAATFCSTGSPSVFLHAAEAAHGDLGVYKPGDPTLLISKSGSTAEMLRLIPVLRGFQSPLIAILGNFNSPLAREADVVLDGRVAREADPLGLAPTCSTTVALAIGDALAIALMRAREFSDQDFARFHPAGQLGRNLTLRVVDVCHTADEVAWVQAETLVRDVIIAMTRRPLGAACVVDDGYRLLGLITDGDLRRTLLHHDDIRSLRAADIMTPRPIAISPEASLKDAAGLMEERAQQIAVLPVIEHTSKRCLGLVRIHDIYQPNLF